MARFHYLFLFSYLVLPTMQTVRHGFPSELLHVNQQDELLALKNNMEIIDLNNFESAGRSKRSVLASTSSSTYTSPNTSFKPKSGDSNSRIPPPMINRLNDSHAQLMVHWLGEGTNVMLCLAREPPPSPLDDIKTSKIEPSSVYISYNNGDTFEDKTNLFNITINNTTKISSIDQFITNPKYNTIVFSDPRNKAIFTNSDHGKTIRPYNLQFTPSEVSFYEHDARTFLVLDKEDPERKLYYTIDFGQTFTLLQSFVKSFAWSSSLDASMPVHLYIERKEPEGSSNVVFMNAAKLLTNDPKTFNLLIENVQDFYIKKDFMFATRKVLNSTQLFISYRRERFIKANFQTELEIKGLHIADVENRRIMVSAVHSETLSHLYVSESDSKMTSIMFVPSLERVFTFIPQLSWQSSWLVQTSDEAFTDVYKIEGLRGIYIASKVNVVSQNSKLNTIGPEHLTSVITFDHGSTWKPIQAPTVDDEGQPINCTKACSLHLSQKFSQLYPVTRSVTIMSSKSAPGVIMATGVVGKSLKGHPCVFISRDAGQTWKQILKNYYFFNYGDHGGILVAVKYFKSKGETNEVLYSTDEGVTWVAYPFGNKQLKVYGLMTEPKSNSTEFTLFGSEPTEHSWLILKIDLKNAFESNCTTDDYKYWSPGSHTGESIVPCILGLQETYQRRAAHSKCYNGRNYERPNRTEVCQCSSWDFECDYGFTRQNNKSPCTIDKSLKIDVYKVPDTCRPGQFYNRTKGYRLIEGDVCVDGYSSQYLPQQIPCPIDIGFQDDFMIVAQRDKVSRINIPSGKTQVLPINGLKNVIAIEYDIKHNCVFWADIFTDRIGRQCLNGNESMEILLEIDLISVEGMSYDWISELLYFVDASRYKIEAIKTSSEHGKPRIRKTIIDAGSSAKPRGLVVHPMAGYLFWTDWGYIKPSISRSHLNGTNIEVLFTKPQVVWPNGITIDFGADRVYWVDASKDYIASCDLQGKTFKKIIEHDSRITHPFAVAVYKDLLYWDDWKLNAVFAADKDLGVMVHTIAENMTSLMDIKIYGHSLQSGSNACSKPNNCSYICVGAPQNKFSCLCPDGMFMSANGECLCPGFLAPFANKTCPQMSNTCAPGFFTCAKKLCIPSIYRCDGENDCGDNSDEQNCVVTKEVCPPRMFQCVSDGTCIAESFKCDHDKDCADGSDEANCNFSNCKENEFRCNNGLCINKMWECDDDDDCHDNSDENHCNRNNSTGSCKPNEFKCKSNDQCISAGWRCDNDNDCMDGSDEEDCHRTKCDDWMFACGDGICIYNTWKCDGDRDCQNGHDEENCPAVVKPPEKADDFTPKCHDWMFKCANNRCIPYWWKCDTINDCGDMSDELGCPNNNVTSTTTEPSIIIPKSICNSTQFTCETGRCIERTYICDGFPDCAAGEDEKDCPRAGCARGKFKCLSDGICLDRSKLCDGILHCVDGSDESDCTKEDKKFNDTITCPPGQFQCDNRCVPQSKICDGKVDCYDNKDEMSCDATNRPFHQINYLFPYKRTLNATSFLVFWYMPKAASDSRKFEYLPTISEVNTNKWTNHTEWIQDTQHRFSNLKPFTTYNVTVYAREKGSIDVDPPYFFINVTTDEGVPNPPLNVNVTQLNGSRVQVSWDPPKQAYGILKEYTVYYRPQTNSVQQAHFVKVSPQEHSIVLESNFEPNTTYEYYVRARNSKNESPNSRLVRLTFDDSANMDRLNGLHVTHIGPDYIQVEWSPIKGVDGYLVQATLPYPYPKLEAHKITDTKYRLNNLVQGVPINIKVSGYIKNLTGRPASISSILQGTPLPEVPKVASVHDPSHTILSWSAPTGNLQNLTYGIYYGTTMDELIEKPRVITQELKVELNDLLPCESYMISVAIVGPIGPGPLSHSPILLNTQYNENKPPRKLQASISDDTKLYITWEHNCPLIGQYPEAYILNITELTSNNHTTTELKMKGARVLSYTFAGVQRGAVYNISIASKGESSKPATITVNGPQLTAPRQLKVFLQENGTYSVFWREIDDDGDSYEYELVIVPGLKINSTTFTPLIKAMAKKPPISLDPNDFGGSSAIGNVFTVGIRAKSSKGFYSPIQEIEHIEIQPDAWLTAAAPAKKSWWYITIPLLLVITLVSAVGYMYQRNRRLSNSFSRFANSHYDTKTGATRIGDALDDDDPHSGTENINDLPRFDDDEPLVIT